MAIANLVAPIGADEFKPVLRTLRFSRHPVNQLIIERGEANPGEMFILEGIVRTFLSDTDGREVTLNFHVGPCTYTPSIGRELRSISRVDCASLTPVRVARFPSDALIKCMVENKGVQRWGDTVLRDELIRRADSGMDTCSASGHRTTAAVQTVIPGTRRSDPASLYRQLSRHDRGNLESIEIAAKCRGSTSRKGAWMILVAESLTQINDAPPR